MQAAFFGIRSDEIWLAHWASWGVAEPFGAALHHRLESRRREAIVPGRPPQDLLVQLIAE